MDSGNSKAIAPSLLPHYVTWAHDFSSTPAAIKYATETSWLVKIFLEQIEYQFKDAFLARKETSGRGGGGVQFLNWGDGRSALSGVCTQQSARSLSSWTLLDMTSWFLLTLQNISTTNWISNQRCTSSTLGNTGGGGFQFLDWRCGWSAFVGLCTKQSARSLSSSTLLWHELMIPRPLHLLSNTQVTAPDSSKHFWNRLNISSKTREETLGGVRGCAKSPRKNTSVQLIRQGSTPRDKLAIQII